MKNGLLNTKTEGTILFNIDFTPKGESEMIVVSVYAKNRLEASNYLILNRIFGTQHEIRPATSSLLK